MSKWIAFYRKEMAFYAQQTHIVQNWRLVKSPKYIFAVANEYNAHLTRARLSASQLPFCFDENTFIKSHIQLKTRVNSTK